MSDNNHKNVSEEEQADPSSIPMTPWYDPEQLLKTAFQVLVSGLFTHHADRRAFYTEWDKDKLKPLPDYDQSPHQLKSFNEDEFWFDFVADTGDGGNSTYAVASQLLADEIRVDIDDKIPENPDLLALAFQLKKDDLLALPRGNALILGGDLVYPTASELEYKKKFVNIFKAALPKETRDEISKRDFQPDQPKIQRHVFAFPQNHDWYDSLASFSQIFCGVETKFLDMFCQQRQSYAAIKLTNNWWLFGLDLALSGDIDELQFEYFRKIIDGYNEEDGSRIAGLTEKSNVILVYPEPVWTKAAFGEPKSRGTYRFEQLEVKIEQATGKDITLRLAGDQHYYRRYSTADSRNHMVTCGSGGAFLHPTHGPEKIDELHHIRRLNTLDMPRRFRFYQDISKESIPDSETVRFHTNNLRNFPDRETSFSLLKKNPFTFLHQNKLFGLVTGSTYFLVVWIVFAALHTDIKTANIISSFSKRKFLLIKQIDFSHFIEAAEAWTWAIFLSPGSLIIMIGILLAFTEFTRSFNSHAPSESRLAGLLHGFVHLTMVFVCYWVVLFVGKLLNIGEFDPINAKIEFIPFLIAGMSVFILGYIVGSLIMGCYLYITLNLHRWIKKFPFLHSNEAFSSLKIQDYKGFIRFRITQEKLEALFIGIEKVPTKWRLPQEPEKKPTWEEAVEDGCFPALKPILYDYWVVKNNSVD